MSLWKKVPGVSAFRNPVRFAHDSDAALGPGRRGQAPVRMSGVRTDAGKHAADRTGRRTSARLVSRRADAWSCGCAGAREERST
ncbi:MAG: hypothetical protein ACRDT7_07330 [Microbacterium sp.]